MSDKAILSKKLTFEEFCEALADAWIEADETEPTRPNADFRRKVFAALEERVEEL